MCIPKEYDKNLFESDDEYEFVVEEEEEFEYIEDVDYFADEYIEDAFEIIFQITTTTTDLAP